MTVVGLTGGIGAGKSTVASLFEEWGAHVVDVDALGRQAIAPGTPGGDAVKTRLGTTDRGTLARLVFADPHLRHELEDISWPIIEEEIRRVVASTKIELLVLDMAVLAQGLAKGLYGPVVTIEAPKSLRLERLIGRGLEESDAAARMQSQLPEAGRRRLADFVIINDGPIEQLRQQAQAVITQLRRVHHSQRTEADR